MRLSRQSRYTTGSCLPPLPITTLLPAGRLKFRLRQLVPHARHKFFWRARSWPLDAAEGGAHLFLCRWFVTEAVKGGRATRQLAPWRPKVAVGWFSADGREVNL